MVDSESRDVLGGCEPSSARTQGALIPGRMGATEDEAMRRFKRSRADALDRGPRRLRSRRRRGAAPPRPEPPPQPDVQAHGKSESTILVSGAENPAPAVDWGALSPRAVRLSESVAARLEAMIVSGELAPCRMLPPERELAQLIGVSRGLVREAITALGI